MTRFFEFRDEDAKPQGGDDSLYLQRVEILPVSVKLDYKPKKVDYAGLSSGRTKEFMNFFNLDGADITLKHAIVYGCRSFARLHQSLEDVWMPDIKRNQLPGILSGLNGVRTLVNVGGGFKNLVVIPVQEYQKDGRVVRSISRGATAFMKTTGSELTKFGARVAVGAHNALQGAEGLFSGQGPSNAFDPDALISDADADATQQPLTDVPVHSNFSEQPAGFLQGLKSAARSLERDLLLTRDVLIAVSGEVRESDSAEGAARAVVRHAPTLVLRPMIGASKAISQTLMGVTNAVDPENRRRMDEVSFPLLSSPLRTAQLTDTGCRNTRDIRWCLQQGLDLSRPLRSQQRIRLTSGDPMTIPFMHCVAALDLLRSSFHCTVSAFNTYSMTAMIQPT